MGEVIAVVDSQAQAQSQAQGQAQSRDSRSTRAGNSRGGSGSSGGGVNGVGVVVELQGPVKRGDGLVFDCRSPFPPPPINISGDPLSYTH